MYEGDSFSLPRLNIESSPNVDNVDWTRDGDPLRSGIVVTATTFDIMSTNCSDRGMYTVVAGNSVGSSIFSFTLAVICKHFLFLILTIV